MKRLVKHLTATDAADFVRGVSAPAVRRRIERHLATGCGRCPRAVTLYRQIAATARRDADRPGIGLADRSAERRGASVSECVRRIPFRLRRPRANAAAHSVWRANGTRRAAVTAPQARFES